MVNQSWGVNKYWLMIDNPAKTKGYSENTGLWGVNMAIVVHHDGPWMVNSEETQQLHVLLLDSGALGVVCYVRALFHHFHQESFGGHLAAHECILGHAILSNILRGQNIC